MKKFFLYDYPLGRDAQSFVALFFRLFIGMMMLTHGMAKLSNFGVMSAAFPDPLGVGPAASLTLSILAEVGCSLLIIVGLFTRLAALPLIFNMIIAVTVHAGDPLSAKEPALLYLAFYMVIFFAGSGRYSVDHLLFGQTRR